MATLRTEFEVTCPSCKSTLVIDEGLRRIVRHVEPERTDMPKLDEAHQILAAEKARRDLGWKPQYTLEEGLREAIQWYREFLGRAGRNLR